MRSLRRHPLGWTVGLLLVVLVVAAGWTAIDALRAYRQLDAARGDLAALRQDVSEGAVGDLDGDVASLREHASTAADSVDGVRWWLLAHAPVVGDDVSAVRTVASALDQLSRRAAPPLARAAGMVSPQDLAPRAGRIPLAPLQQAAPLLRRGSDGLQRAARDVGGIDADGLAGPLASAVSAAQDQLDEAASSVDTAARTVTLLPPMLGADGPRRYLLISQNNAEARSLGGIVGAAIVVTADDGRVRLRRQVAGNSFGPLRRPVLPLSQGEKIVFGDQLGLYLLNATNSPDFPRAAELVSARWDRRTGQRLDGVVSVDPGALALLMRATGPVQVDGTRLDAGNVVRTLLSGVYQRYPDPAAQDVFFARAAAAVFEKVSAGDLDAASGAQAARDAVAAHRLMVWSRRPVEQRQLAGTTIAGEFRGAVGDRPVVGAYLDERSASKLSYYLRRDIAVQRTCSADGSTVRVRVTVRSEAPRGAALRRLPDYVAGPPGGAYGAGRGTLLTRVIVTAPRGATVSDARLVGVSDGASSARLDGLWAVYRDVTLRPGGRATFSVSMKVPSGVSGPLILRATPMPVGTNSVIPVLRC